MKADELVKEKSIPPSSIGIHFTMWNWWIGSLDIRPYLGSLRQCGAVFTVQGNAS